MGSSIRKAVLWMLGALAAPASAQLLPPVQAPGLPLPPVQLPQVGEVAAAVPAVARSSVRIRARELQRRYPDRVENDPRGAPIMRAVILALSPDDAALQRALRSGFEIQSDRNLQSLGERVVLLLAPRGTSTRRALQILREADPGGSYDFDHLFVESQAAAASASQSAHAAVAAPVAIRVGLIDGGVDAAHEVFARQRPHVTGCDGQPVVSAHATAVASLFVGWADHFQGAAPGAMLEAVDVYCDRSAPGGRVSDIAQALAELATAKVRVINISVVGPDNAVLAAVVRKVLASSISIVAAVGNDGPNARPLFPAAYPGVIAATAVDAHQRVLAEACSGTHVGFAAPGADLLAAAPGGSYAVVRGTSYAAPLVAGLLAGQLAVADRVEPVQALQRLSAAAKDLGKPGRDNRYGMGLVGADLRIAAMDGSVPRGRRAQ
jgi:hypothetical protein